MFSKTCPHSRAYEYFAQSVSSKKPIVGYFCNSLDDVKTGNCRGEKSNLGGELETSKKYVNQFLLHRNWRSLFSMISFSPGIYYIYESELDLKGFSFKGFWEASKSVVSWAGNKVVSTLKNIWNRLTGF